MNPRGLIVVLLAVAALGVTAVLIWLGDEADGKGLPLADRVRVVGGRSEPLQVVEPVSFQDQAVVEPLATDPIELNASASSPASEVGPVASLAGRVVLAGAGTPVAGVTVSFRFDPPLEEDETPIAEGTEAQTNAAGEFRLALGRAAVLVRVDVAAGPATYAAHETPDLALVPGESVVLELTVPPTSVLLGRVVTDDGVSVPGAEVRGWRRPRWRVNSVVALAPERVAVADGAGNFELRGVGPAFVLSARAPGLIAVRRVCGQAPAGERIDGLEVVLAPQRKLDVRVVDPAGGAVSGARVELLQAELPPRERITERPGVFRLGADPLADTTEASGRAVFATADGAYEVTVSHDDFASWQGSHDPADGELLVQLEAGNSVLGRVVSSDGRAVTGALVLLERSLFGRRADRRETTTEADGRFVFSHLWESQAGILSVRALGHAVSVIHPLVVGPKRTDELRLVLEDERRLAGIVVDAAGEPVVGADVSLQGDRVLDFGDGAMMPLPTWEGRVGLSQTTTDDEGRFAVGQLYDGVFKLTVTDPDDQALATSVELAAGTEDARIVLDPNVMSGVTLTGTLRDGTTGLPVTSFRVTPMVPQGSGLVGNGHSFEDEQGAWRITGLDPGEMQITAGATGYAPWSQPVESFGEGTHRLDIELLPNRTLHLRIVDDDREPISSAALSFLDRNGTSLMVAVGPRSRSSILKTDDAGEAIAQELPAAPITVVVKSGWFGKRQRFDLDLRSEPRGVQELVLGEVAELSLAVLVFGSTEPRELVFDPAAPEQSLGALQQLVEAGAVWPLDVEGQLVARRVDGESVGQAAVARGASSRAPFALPTGEQLAAAVLDVPIERLSVELSASGYRTTTVDWVPHRRAEAPEVVLVFVPRE